MDGSNIEHSDSDSGESWSLVEHIPSYGDEVPEFPETTPANERDVADANIDKDEDTDGISIISDSDPESSMPYESSYTKNVNNCPETQEFISINPLTSEPPNNNDELHESMRSDDDFLGDNNGKHKTYVHRRNKRLSTVLNIIVLGSVITAAGVAIGHMWGAKNDCINNTPPSVNKILSNLYKLQEENAYLRSKLKELTLMNNIQFQQRKSGTEKQNKCKKVFEESLNKIADKPTKCVDNGDIPKLLEMHTMEGEHDKEFLRDIDKLKQVYKQNKSWLDDEVSKRMKFEQQSIKRMKHNLNSLKKENKDTTQSKGDNFEIVLETINEQPIIDASIPELSELPINPNISEEQSTTDRKVSYADSLKSEQKFNNIQKKVTIISSDVNPKEHIKRKNNKELDPLPNMQSEEEIKKDDRYVKPKHKQERKKYDRQKLHKKQKRKNKYEQWEMKGGYLKDYDDFSITSSQENEYVLKNPDKNFLAKDFERENYIEQFSETDKKSDTRDIKMNPKHGKEKHGKTKEKDNTWFEKRAVLRNEARKKLEHELFGETSPNNAGWYFRRMQRREQCRAKGDNSTYRKLFKRNMNFKMKH